MVINKVKSWESPTGRTLFSLTFKRHFIYFLCFTFINLDSSKASWPQVYSVHSQSGWSVCAFLLRNDCSKWRRFLRLELLKTESKWKVSDVPWRKSSLRKSGKVINIVRQSAWRSPGLSQGRGTREIWAMSFGRVPQTFPTSLLVPLA